MLNFNRTEDLTEELAKTLRTYLESQSLGFAEIFNEWPAGNFTMEYPSLTIITSGNPSFRKSCNSPIVLIDSPIVDSQAKVLRETGYWEFDLQLDLWCKNKNQRSEFLRKMEEALDPDTMSEGKSGLHLAMPEYYNQICSYTYDGYSYEDSEISAQRREWRALIRVKADARSLRDKVEFMMETIELDLETKNEFEELDPQI